MVQAGYMTEGQVVGARRHPAVAVDRRQSPSPDYFLDYAYEEVKKHVDGEQKVLVARTTLDTRLQQAAEEAVESTLRESGDAYRVRQAALVGLDLDGRIRSMVGGRDYGTSTFNRAVNALRQPGSSFKPYVYATAVEMKDYTPEHMVVDAPVSIGNWSPQNYGRSFKGRLTMRSALTQSLNTVAVRLSIETGREPIAEMVARLGARTPVRVTRSLALGTSELTVLDQATAYAAFANGGYRIEPHAIVSITGPDGETLYDGTGSFGQRERVLKESTVLTMVDMMHSVVENGTARRARLPGINAAGKTGTTNAYRDAWFVGYTGNFSAAVWFGNDDFSPTNRLTGGILPAQTWQRFMRVAHAYEVIRQLPGLPPPAEDREAKVAAAAAGAQPFTPGASSRLSSASADALGKLEGRFREAGGIPMRQASLPVPDAAAR
jgi:penicillin-binding protein 1A